MAELIERVVKLEVISKRHEELLSTQIQKNETLATMAVLMERQNERDERQNEQIERMTETLQGINSNLTTLNNTQQQMRADLSNIGTRVTKVEEEQKASIDATTIDTKGFIKNVTIWGIGAIGTIILTYVMIKWGLR